MAPHDVTAYLDLVPVVLRSPHRFLWSSYDADDPASLLPSFTR
jgi:hypothetical protein